jgi:FlaA1/EpsC-like NDP-sugar epimerase
MLTIGFRGGWRLARRFYFESVAPKFDDAEVEPAFLVGANNRGAHVANAINSQPDLPYRVVGFLTIHDFKVRLRVGSLPVVAHIDNLVYAAKQRNVKTILCVAGLLPGKTFREIYERCDKNGLKLEIVPQVEFIPDTKTPIREVKVDDLLKRDPIRLDTERIKRQVTGRRVMVTGAGGSIGSEICRQLMRFEPAELFILGRGENRIFFLERELRALGKSTKITPIIADVSNKERVDGVFDAAKPEIVFHAAAHKHVPLMEANVPEAIRNNIYGTKVVADAADRCGAEKFVMVSTDKAVNPTNVMGCSKQMAERYVNALAERSKTKFIVTRFGNVLGSNGSVVPIFTKQIQQGGPITITDFRMTRYFMTIPEAAQLVLEAGAMGQGGEIFVLDMGEPVKIETLARDLIRLSGLPENAIEIREVGLRPGEKLYEELYFETETRIETDQKKIFAANHRQFKLEEIQAQLDELLSMTGGPQEKIRERLTDFVPEYKPTVLPEKK